MSAPVLSLAIAVGGAGANLAAILEALPEDPRVEILLCHGAGEPLPFALPPHARAVAGRPDALIPELWRDGFRAARGTWVATLTAHCPPAPGWLACALGLVAAATGRHVAFGGAILPGPEADRLTRAIHALRYANAGAEGGRREVWDLSADNAIYRRGSVLACEDLLPDGFWEPNYHRRFLSDGLVMELVPELAVIHRNRYSAAAFREQRRRHGRVFGRHRSEGRLWPARLGMLLASPAAFPIFALKQMRKIRARPDLRALLEGAEGPFLGFMAAWCLGEAQGYADALLGRRGELDR